MQVKQNSVTVGMEGAVDSMAQKCRQWSQSLYTVRVLVPVMLLGACLTAAHLTGGQLAATATLDAAGDNILLAQTGVEGRLADAQRRVQRVVGSNASIAELLSENRLLKEMVTVLAAQQKHVSNSFNAAGGWKMVGYFRGSAQWPTMPVDVPNFGSQVFEDETVMKIFGRKRDGFFVDLAANDASALSNTVTLEQQLGWNGLCFESNPEFMPVLMKRDW